MSDAKRKQIDLDSSGELEREAIRTIKKPTTDTKGEYFDIMSTSRLEKMIEELIKKVDENTEETRKLREDSKEKEQKWNKERQEMGDKITKLEKRLEGLDRERRRNNVIIKGIDLDGHNLSETVSKLIKEKLNVETQVKSAVLMDRTDTKVIIVQLRDFQEKMKVMKNKYKLKGLNIYMEDDLTPAERQTQYEIRKKAKEIGNMGKAVKIGYRKLIVDGEIYKWNETQHELVALGKK